MNWTQPICLECWNRRNPERFVHHLEERGDPERCAFCGGGTWHGLYVRADPETVPFPTLDDEDDE